MVRGGARYRMVQGGERHTACEVFNQPSKVTQFGVYFPHFIKEE
jgi:hypothetical protein